jgi:hypothetical protein
VTDHDQALQRQSSTPSDQTSLTESQAESHFAVDIESRRQLNELQRLEQTHGNNVHEWLAEGMPRKSMGNPTEMRAFRMQDDPSESTPAESKRTLSVQRYQNLEPNEDQLNFIDILQDELFDNVEEPEVIPPAQQIAALTDALQAQAVPPQTPIQTPFQTPMQSPPQTPTQTPFQTPMQSPPQTPTQTHPHPFAAHVQSAWDQGEDTEDVLAPAQQIAGLISQMEIQTNTPR